MNNGASSGASNALPGALARRERHQKRPLIVRALTLAALVPFVVASVEVWLRFGFLPPLFLPVVVALLALEFLWAARVVAWGLDRLARFTRRARGFLSRLRR
jgi:hypothetical protein